MADTLSSISPGTKKETDVVTRKVFINGTVLSNQTLLSQITINKSFNKIASAKIIFFDGSASNRDFPLSNDDKFKPGSTIKIQLGYHGEVDTVFEGIIIKHSIKVRQHASSLLTIEAKDKAVKLTMARKSVYHINETDSDVIKELASDLAGDIDATKFSFKQLVQFDTTDWDFIVTRAEANGMFVLTDDGKLNAKKPSSSGTAVLKATYGDNIWDFEAEMDARKQIKQITSHSWDFTKQKVEESDPGAATFSENGNLSSNDLGGVLNAEIKLNHSGHLTEDQLNDWSNAYAMRNHLLKIIGRVRIKGDASVKPGN
ncbi:MAG: phage late control D family protein, partial [Flavisolibacter sp.]